MVMMIGAVGIVFWATRNLFSPLLVTTGLVFVPLYVGCLMISERDPRGVGLAFLAAVGVLSAAMGCLAARQMMHFKPHQELEEFRKGKVDSFLTSRAMFTLTLFTLLVLGMVTVVVFFVRAGVPLLSEDIFGAKIEAPRTGGYLSVRFMRLFLPLLVMIYVVGYRVKVRPNRFLIAITAVFILAAFTLFGYRSYVLNYFLVPFVLLLGYQKVSKRTIFFLGAAALGSAVGITAYAYRDSGFQSLWDILSERLFLAVVLQAFHPVVYVIVPVEGYMYGRGFWMDIPAVLSRIGIGEPGVKTFGQYLAAYTFGESSYSWQTTATLIGEAYANFGIAGVVAVLFLFGFLMQWLYVRTLRAAKDVLLLPLRVYWQLSLLIAAGGPFVFIVIDMAGSLFLFAFVFILVYIFWSLPARGPKFGPILWRPRGRKQVATFRKSTPSHPVPSGRT
jgi:oligosaccharide repeat unit polymerase